MRKEIHRPFLIEHHPPGSRVRRVGRCLYDGEVCKLKMKERVCPLSGDNSLPGNGKPRRREGRTGCRNFNESRPVLVVDF
jgi:hypothetical protein